MNQAKDVLNEPVTFTVRHQLAVTDLIELVNSAFETGAINYWTDEVIDYKRAPEGRFDHNYCYQFTIKADDEILGITVDTIRKGIQAILDNKIELGTTLRAYITNALTEADLGYIDSEALDAIVQAGLFGDIVYA